MSNSKALSPTKSNDINGPVLPPKPYTEYTIFFRLERTHILQSSGIIDEEVVASLNPNHEDALEFPRPAKYQDLCLPPYWYSSKNKAAIEKKRKHRKRDGRMDMKTLSKTVSASWRNADRELKDYCKKLARAELKRYNAECEAIMEEHESQTAASEEHRQFSDGLVSLQDFDVAPNKSKQIAPTVPIAHSMAMTVPSSGIEQMLIRMSGSKGMGFGGTGINREDEILLKMLQLQASQQNNASACANVLPNVASISPPFANTNSTQSASPTKKRKFMRRAPPEFKCPADLQTSMGMNNNGITPTPATINNNILNSNNNNFVGEDISRLLKRRVSVTPVTNQEERSEFEAVRPASATSIVPQHLEVEELKKLRRSTQVVAAQHELSDSSQKRIGNDSNHSFTCVPHWEKDDAVELLNILTDAKVNEPLAHIDIEPIEMPDTFMESFRVGAGQQIGNFGFLR